jgi:hypothetical protein
MFVTDKKMKLYRTPAATAGAADGRAFRLMLLMTTDSVAVPAGRRLTDGRTIGAVGQLVQTTSIAQIVIVAVTAP